MSMMVIMTMCMIMIVMLLVVMSGSLVCVGVMVVFHRVAMLTA